MIVLMPGHQTDASIIKVTMKEPSINNSKTFKIDEKLTLFFLAELKDTYYSILSKRLSINLIVISTGLY